MSSEGALYYYNKEFDSRPEDYSQFMRYYKQSFHGLDFNGKWEISDFEKYQDDIYLDRNSKEYFEKKLLALIEDRESTEFLIKALRRKQRSNWILNRYTNYADQKWGKSVIQHTKLIEAIKEFNDLEFIDSEINDVKKNLL